MFKERVWFEFQMGREKEEPFLQSTIQLQYNVWIIWKYFSFYKATTQPSLNVASTLNQYSMLSIYYFMFKMLSITRIIFH